MRMTKNFVGLSFAFLLLIESASAQIYRLDDSSSAQGRVEARYVTNEFGAPLAATNSADFMFLKFGLVQYRLATSAYKGQKAKIYYVIPLFIEGLQNPRALTVRWKGNRLLADGTGHAGERQLVWSGIVTEDWMQDEMDLEMQVELAQLRLREGQGFGFESYFEIEINE